MKISAACRTDMMRQLEMIPAIAAVDTSRLIEAVGLDSLLAEDRDAVVDCVNSKMRMDIVTSIGDNPEAPDGKQKQHNNYLHNYYTQEEWDYFRSEGAQAEVCLDKVAPKIVDLRHRRAVEGELWKSAVAIIPWACPVQLHMHPLEMVRRLKTKVRLMFKMLTCAVDGPDTYPEQPINLRDTHPGIYDRCFAQAQPVPVPTNLRIDELRMLQALQPSRASHGSCNTSAIPVRGNTVQNASCSDGGGLRGLQIFADKVRPRQRIPAAAARMTDMEAICQDRPFTLQLRDMIRDAMSPSPSQSPGQSKTSSPVAGPEQQPKAALAIEDAGATKPADVGAPTSATKPADVGADAAASIDHMKTLMKESKDEKAAAKAKPKAAGKAKGKAKGKASPTVKATATGKAKLAKPMVVKTICKTPAGCVLMKRPAAAPPMLVCPGYKKQKAPIKIGPCTIYWGGNGWRVKPFPGSRRTKMFACTTAADVNLEWSAVNKHVRSFL